MLGGAGPAAEIAFGAHSSRLKPAKTIRNGRVLVFEPSTVDAAGLTRATLAHAGKRKGLNPAAVQRSLNRTGTAHIQDPTALDSGGRAHRKHRAIRRPARKRIARAPGS